MPGRETLPGTTHGKCARCNAAVYLSPSSVKLMEQMQAEVVCDECLPGATEGKQIVPALAPGAVQELAAYIKKAHLN